MSVSVMNTSFLPRVGGRACRLLARRCPFASMTRNVTALVTLVMVMLGCASQPSDINPDMTHSMVRGKPFTLATWHRGLGHRTRALHVYIEGDGRSHVRKRLSHDPTPRNPIGFRLANADTAPAVLYIARPCQYQPDDMPSECHPAFWGDFRYSETVVSSIDSVINDRLQAWRGAKPPLVLVGYSGGGTLAALLADRRSDVAGLVTVAANLDHDAWNAHHETPALSGSLNPTALSSERLSTLKQMHLAGSDDEVVPPWLVRRFAEAHRLSADTVEVVDGFDHRSKWERLWPRPLCRVSPERTPCP